MDTTLQQLISGLWAYAARQRELEAEVTDLTKKLLDAGRLSADLQQDVDNLTEQITKLNEAWKERPEPPTPPSIFRRDHAVQATPHG